MSRAQKNPTSPLGRTNYGHAHRVSVLALLRVDASFRPPTSSAAVACPPPALLPTPSMRRLDNDDAPANQRRGKRHNLR